VDRTFALFLVCNLLFGAAALHWMPAVTGAVGVPGVFALLAGLFVLSLLLCRYLPLSIENLSTQSNNVQTQSAAWIALAAGLIYSVAQGAVWQYLELIGERDGLARQTVATAVAFSTLAAISAPLVAAVVGPRFGRAWPLFISLCMTLAALYLLGLSLDARRFVVAACLFQIGWNFSAPYQPALIAACDQSGRVVAWLAMSALAGWAAGLAAGAVAFQAAGFTGVLWLGATLSILSFVGFAPALRKVSGREKEVSMNLESV
jgi:hypothetical protein